MERPNASGRGVGRWLCLEWQDVPQPVEDRPGHHRHPLERTPVLWFARQTVEGAAVMKTRGSASARKGGSFSVSSNARRRSVTRSAGTPGGGHVYRKGRLEQHVLGNRDSPAQLGSRTA